MYIFLFICNLFYNSVMIVCRCECIIQRHFRNPVK